MLRRCRVQRAVRVGVAKIDACPHDLYEFRERVTTPATIGGRSPAGTVRKHSPSVRYRAWTECRKARPRRDPLPG